MTRGKHTSVPRGAVPTVRWLERQPDIQKIIFGECKPRRYQQPDVKIVGPHPGGLTLLTRADNCSLELFVYTRDPNAVANRIGARFA